MSNKSWLVTAVPLIVAIGFAAISLATGHDVTQTEADLLDKLFYWFVGGGLIGSGTAGYKKYIDWKSKVPK